jgi:hypothetical protein
MQALEHNVFRSLLVCLLEEDDARLHQAVLLCLAELFTPASRQAASSNQKYLRLAAQALVEQVQ